MQESKLTIRVSRDVIANAKGYAQKNNTTLTRLIETYLRRIPVQRTLEHQPIVQWLTGRVSKKVTMDDYRHYIEGKYGQKTTRSD